MSDHRPFRIAIAGLGTVGASVARCLLDNADHYSDVCKREMVIAAVCVKNKSKDRGLVFSDAVQWYDDPVTMAREADVDCIVELMGGTGKNVVDLIQIAVKRNIKLVTANKAYLAANIRLLENPLIRFEAAVAGGIPVIDTIRESLRGNKIHKITAILNGTCNYILHTLETAPQSFEGIIKKAQEAGYAEADPTFDISGADATQKAMILSYLAFGETPEYESIQREGLDENTPNKVESACTENEVIRMVAEIERKQTDISIRISQKRFKRTDDFASVIAAQNAILIEADPVNTLFLKGYGAGGKPTASAVLADICSHALR